MYIADRRLWYTADKSRVVDEGDPEARFLFATPGTRVPVAEARALGLVADEADAAPESPQHPDERGSDAPAEDASADAADESDDAGTKAVNAAPSNKARKPAGNKQAH